MSEEKTNLLKLLFPGADIALFDNNAYFDDYVQKIGTLKSEELTKEPDKLKEERALIRDHTQELAIANYKTFIQTSQCSHDTFDSLSNIEVNLDNLLLNIPQFEKKCHDFTINTSSINTLRRLNSLTLTRSAQLLEILELPQLMDSFIKDGCYEDALELAAYVRKLYAKHQEIPIFKSITDEVNQAWLLMLHNLLGLLRGDLQLSRCLQIVSYLRRMEIFSEPELRLKFLQTREVWLNNSLNAILQSNTNHRLNKVIEVTRVNLFSIITQYQAIFNDDERTPLMSNKTDVLNYNTIFFSWIRIKIFDFLNTLESELEQEVASIDSILGQCMYFGLSLSRVGCDFRAAMVPIFNNAIKRQFRRSVLTATKNFEENMERFTLINKNHPSVPWKNKKSDPIQPPESLLEFYPLAEYLNHILVGFNELRLCPPMSIIGDVVKSLDDSLLFISKAILILYGQEQQAFNSNSRDSFSRMCLCFVDDLIPYMQKCLSIIYPSNFVASHLSFSIQNLQKEGILLINKDAITEPIQHLLPVKVDHTISEAKVKENISEEHVIEENVIKENLK